MRSFPAIMMVTLFASCTTWTTVQKGQLPVIARAFETKTPVEVTGSDNGENEVVEIDWRTRYHLESSDAVVYSGPLESLSLHTSARPEAVRLVPRLSSRERRKKVEPRLIEVPVSELDLIRVSRVDGRKTAVLLGSVVGAVLVIAGLGTYFYLQNALRGL